MLCDCRNTSTQSWVNEYLCQIFRQVCPSDLPVGTESRAPSSQVVQAHPPLIAASFFVFFLIFFSPGIYNRKIRRRSLSYLNEYGDVFAGVYADDLRISSTQESIYTEIGSVK